MKILYGFTVIALVLTVRSAFADVDPWIVRDIAYKIEVRIINKAKLPPERLADALYAKSVLTDKPELLVQAAKLVPSDPVYVYRQLPSGMDQFSTGTIRGAVAQFGDEKQKQAWEKRATQEADKARKLLDRVLAIDPKHPPALYAGAVVKPTLQGKMQALEKIASMDPDNAKPYYVMAMLQYRSLTEGRKVTEESRLNAYPLKGDEWASVLDLLRKGNARPVLRVTSVRVPSVRDIRVTTRGRAWPEEAVSGCVKSIVNDSMLGGIEEIPGSISGNATARQLARQAAWEAHEAYMQGKRSEALDMLKVARGFADKCAASEPHRLMPLLVVVAMRAILRPSQEEILRAMADQAGLLAFNKDKLAWEEAVRECKPVLQASSKIVKGVNLSSSEPLRYTDIAVEEAGVSRILKKLGL